MSHDDFQPVRVVSPGVVRCLLRQPYYLRIPKDNDFTEARTIKLLPDVDVELQYRDFDLVRGELIQLDKKNIVRIVKFPEFLPDDTDLNIQVYQQGTLIASDISALNFVGSGAVVTDAGNGRADIFAGTSVGGAPPQSVGSTNQEGVEPEVARRDHVHQGVHSISNTTLGTPRYGDVVLQAGSNIMITEPVGGTFSFDVVVGATDELQVFMQGSPALAVDYRAGKVSYEGVPYQIPAGILAGLTPSSTLEVFVDTDGIVKFAASIPGNATWMATVTTDGSAVTGVVDRRVFLNQTFISGLTADISGIAPDGTTSSGILARYARADHTHAAPCDAPIQIIPNQANAEGISSSFARADHVHNLQTASAVGINANSTNAEGNATTFARSNHTHAIPTAAAVTLIPDAPNAAGTSTSFSRADHVHNIETDDPISQIPDATNAEGISTSFARADHVHNIPTAAPVAISSALNIQGSASTFSRSDHVHAHGNLIGGTLHAVATTILAGFMSAADKVRLDSITEPDVQLNDVLISSDVEIFNFSGPTVSVTDNGGNKTTIFIGDTPGLHASTHLPLGSDPLTTAAAVTLSATTTNATGNANSFARSNHTHAITTGNVGYLGAGGVGLNSTGTGDAIARADHVHRWEEITAFVDLPGSPVNGQIVYANYGLYKGLYFYDSVRAKWLSMELQQVAWNSGTNVNTANVALISHDDNTQQDNDYPLPVPITIMGLIGAQVNAITSGNSTRFELATYELATATLTQNVASVTLSTIGEYAARDLTLNVDVADLNVLSARRVKVSGSANVTRPMVLVQYRSRLA